MSGTDPDRKLYAAVDVHYSVSDGACAAHVLAGDPRLTEIVENAGVPGSAGVWS